MENNRNMPRKASNADLEGKELPITLYDVEQCFVGEKFIKAEVRPITVIRYGVDHLVGAAIPSISFIDSDGASCRGSVNMFYLNEAGADNEVARLLSLKVTKSADRKLPPNNLVELNNSLFRFIDLANQRLEKLHNNSFEEMLKEGDPIAVISLDDIDHEMDQLRILLSNAGYSIPRFNNVNASDFPDLIAQLPPSYDDRWVFDDGTRRLESEVSALLRDAGWSNTRFGQAADGSGHYIGRFGDIQGAFIGLWHREKHDGCIAQYPVTLPVHEIASSVRELAERKVLGSYIKGY
ncbi:hypothetical protein [Iodobacter fluviatilis]|uniref:Uncharacterized protein n=1 Tax=Iodobacter fluviatilis TaxID=537 RepID=A0A377Q5N4_9NEIS|nr:hypothetical protein [Iodobacter fluviatilis]TCU84564.1 hypothetical protein EV682_10989 [Iodobacter fluviatilis]STQ90030.1 Uncharacterised protein [Iodobacter fluviatilis]